MIIAVNFLGLLIIILVAFFLIKKTRESLDKDSDGKIESLRKEWSETLSNNTRLIMDRLDNMSNSVGSQLGNTAKIFGEVKESIGSLEQRTQQIYEVGKDISSLQEILKAPKMRGGLGELFLENLLEQIMPQKDFYELQYSFKSGERVDAVIRIGKKLVPVDSKFPMESFIRFVEAENDDDKKRFKKEFARAVKEHINNISDKYILPDENTYDFALMYVPAENVYYESIIKDEDLGEQRSIFSHAISKKVIPVSPNSFYAYLQVIITGLKGLEIEEKTHQVIKKIITLKGSLERITTDFDKIGTHIKNVNNSYDATKKRLDRFTDQLTTIDSLAEKKKIEKKS